MAFLTFLMHPGSASPGDKDEPCGLTNDSAEGGVSSSAPAELSQSWKLGWPFLQEQGLFFKLVLNPYFTLLVPYRGREMVFKLYSQVVPCPEGFILRWKSTWGGWGTSCSSTQMWWSSREGHKTQQSCSCAPQQQFSVPLCLPHLLSWSTSNQSSSSCSHHCHPVQSSSRNFVIPPHSLNSLPSHSSGFSPREVARRAE